MIIANTVLPGLRERKKKRRRRNVLNAGRKQNWFKKLIFQKWRWVAVPAVLVEVATKIPKNNL